MTVALKSRCEEQAERRERLEAISQLAAKVAHHLNNHLQVIIGCTMLAVEDLPDGHPAQEMLSQVLRGGERAAELAGQLLSISRQQTLNLETLDVNMVLADQLEKLQEICHDGISIRFRPQAQPGLVKADRSSIEQIVLTLCLNARDAMPGGGLLTLTTADLEPDTEILAQFGPLRPGPYVLIEVSDTGSGIDPAMACHIFEPFFTTKPTGQGTGLGLATVHGLVKQHQGVVLCRSEPNLGAVFQVYLPAI